MIGTYSGGMKRRLDLAAALVHWPEVLFLDEPTTGLDPISRSRVWDEVRKINTELGVTIFLTTQYLEEADALADNVGIIDRGKLAVQGTPKDLKRARGADLIVARLDGDAETATAALRGIPDVSAVEAHGDQLTVSVTNGAVSHKHGSPGPQRTRCCREGIDSPNSHLGGRFPPGHRRAFPGRRWRPRGQHRRRGCKQLRVVITNASVDPMDPNDPLVR